MGKIFIFLSLVINGYSAFELSRICWEWRAYYPADTGLMIFEICFILVCWLGNIGLVILSIKEGKHGN